MADEEPRSCSFCDQYATHTCERCGRPYCDAHGGDLCQDCLSPASALPSERMFRGSLAALAVAGLAGVILLFWSPTLPGERRLASSSAQNPSSVQPASRQGGNGRSAVPTPNPTAAGSPTAPAARSYTVVFGDTLSGIAASFGTTVEAIQAANPGVTPANLKAGQQLLILPPGVTPVPTSTPLVSPTPQQTPQATPAATATAPASETPTAAPSSTPAASPTPAASASPAATPTPSP